MELEPVVRCASRLLSTGAKSVRHLSPRWGLSVSHFPLDYAVGCILTLLRG